MLKAAAGAMALAAVFTSSASWAQKAMFYELSWSTAENRMNEALRRAVSVSSDPSSLQQDQERWNSSLQAECALDKSRERTCEIAHYSARIVELAQFWRTAQPDCSLPISRAARLICEENGLKEQLWKIEALTLRIADAESDPVHRKQILRDQELWRQTLFLYWISDQPIPSEYRDSEVATVAGWLNFRLLELGLLIGDQRTTETIPFDPPIDWWGIDLQPLFKKKKIIPFQMIGDRDRRGLVAISVREPGVGSKAAEYFLSMS